MYYSKDLFKDVFCEIQFTVINDSAASLMAQMVYYGAKIDSDVLVNGILTNDGRSHIFFNEGTFSRKRINGKEYRILFDYILNSRMPFALFSSPVAFILEGSKGFERLYYKQGVSIREISLGINMRSYWFNETNSDIEHPNRMLRLANTYDIKRHDNINKTLTKLFNIKDPEPEKVDVGDEISTIDSEE